MIRSNKKPSLNRTFAFLILAFTPFFGFAQPLHLAGSPYAKIAESLLKLSVAGHTYSLGEGEKDPIDFGSIFFTPENEGSSGSCLSCDFEDTESDEEKESNYTMEKLGRTILLKFAEPVRPDWPTEFKLESPMENFFEPGEIIWSVILGKRKYSINLKKSEFPIEIFISE